MGGKVPLTPHTVNFCEPIAFKVSVSKGVVTKISLSQLGDSSGQDTDTAMTNFQIPNIGWLYISIMIRNELQEEAKFYREHDFCLSCPLG